VVLLVPDDDLLICPICWGNKKQHGCLGCNGQGLVPRARRAELWPHRADLVIEELRKGKSAYLDWPSTAELDTLRERAEKAGVKFRTDSDADRGFYARPPERWKPR